MKFTVDKRLICLVGAIIPLLLVMTLSTFMIDHQSQNKVSLIGQTATTHMLIWPSQFSFFISFQNKNVALRDIKEIEDFSESLPGRERRNAGILRFIARSLSTIPRNDIRCVITCGRYVASLRRAALRNRFSRRRNFVPFYLSCVGLCKGICLSKYRHYLF